MIVLVPTTPSAMRHTPQANATAFAAAFAATIATPADR
jgi:hypothetical protein